MLGLYLSCSIVAMILLIWFRSEAYLEYCRLFNLDKISFYKDYEEKKNQDARLTYLDYLRQYHYNFFTRLITCPVCLSVWVAGGIALLTFKAATFPTSMVGGLLLFALIDKLLE